MTSLTASNSDGAGSAGDVKQGQSQNPNSSNKSRSSPTSSVSHNGEQSGRKKRTFDIAFLTGQNEKYESNNNRDSSFHHSLSNKRNNSHPTRSRSPVVSSHTNTIASISSSSPILSMSSEGRESPFNLSHNEVSSDNSSIVDVDIDVMTNGSLSEAEDEIVTPAKNNKNRHHSNPIPSPNVNHNFNNSRVLLSLSQSHYNNQNHSHNHNKFSQPVKAKSKSKLQKNLPVKEEIRFESKRIIDINHSQDSLKIKENLQFSTLMTNHNHPHSNPHPQFQSQNNAPHFPHELIFPPHFSTFFPQFGSMDMSKFLPVPNHHQHQQQGNPSISSISPNTNSNHSPNQGQSHQHESQLGIHFSSSLNKMEKFEKADVPVSYHQQHQRHPIPSANQSSGANKLRHFPDIYPACGYYPNLIIPPQFSPPGGNVSLSGNSQNSPTLLPPSLTALTLPAQNVCAKCNIGFRMTSDLVYHMRSHHKRDTFDPLKKQREEKLKCPVCHETFRERHHLTRHMTAHQDRLEEKLAAAAAGTSSGSTGIVDNFSVAVAGSSKLVV